MIRSLFSHPFWLAPALALVFATLVLALRAHLRPGAGVRVVGQRPLLQGLGLALAWAGLGLGLAEPRYGSPEVPRLTVHVVVDASRSMLARDCGGRSRWEAASILLDRLWDQPSPGIRFSLDLLTGDALPLLPPGEDRTLLSDALKAVRPGDTGSPGSSYGRGLPQVAAQAEPKAPATKSAAKSTTKAPAAKAAAAKAAPAKAPKPKA